MNKIILSFFAVALFFVLAFSSGAARAQDRGLGLGLVAGEPSGVTAKLWLSEKSAIDGAFGFSLGGDRLFYNGASKWWRLHAHADYLHHFFDLIGSSGRVPFYVGGGPRLNFGGDYGAAFGIRGVAGVAWMMERAPFDVFVEAAPTVQFGHDTGFAAEGGVGVRYYF